MRLTELLAAADLCVAQYRGDAEVADVQIDSRRCGPDSCFVAIRGAAEDGHKYIPAALAAGASAVVCEDPSAAGASGACAVVDDARAAAGPLAQAIRAWPVRQLAAIGITGTNGKTTVAHLISAVLVEAGLRPARLGTITYETGVRTVQASTTTPGPVELAEMTAEMVSSGRTHLVMEVSSHALDQGRTGGLDFAVGVFTNLTGDHLDYHETMEQYLAAKRRLFEQLGPDATAVINRDDPAGEVIAAATRGRVILYGLDGSAELAGRIEASDVTGARFTLSCGEASVAVATPLIGRHNVANCLAAAGACVAVGVDLPTIASALAKVRWVPGRLQPVPGDAPFRVFVDYAHTDDALANVLGSLRPLTRGRLVVVFGCGGDRDRTKRPRMAAVAGRLADRVVVTSDNPRSETPESIIAQIVTGLDQPGLAKTTVEPDRRAAIGLAVDEAGPGDVVLIAGKGHEDYQEIAGRRTHFDDAEVAGQCLRAGAGRP